MAGTPWRYQPITERRQQDSEEFQQYAGQRMQEMEQESGGGGLLGGIGDAVGGAVGGAADLVGDAAGAVGSGLDTAYESTLGQLPEPVQGVGDLFLSGTNPVYGAAQATRGLLGGPSQIADRASNVGQGIGMMFSGEQTQEALGIDTGYLDSLRDQGLLGQVGASAIDVGTAPGTAAIAGAGGPLAASMRAGGGLAGKVGAGLVEPVTGGGIGSRFAGEVALGTGAHTAAEGAAQVTDNPILQMGAGLAGGVASAGAFGKAFGRGAFRQGEETATEQAGRQAAQQVEDTGQLGAANISGSQTRMFDMPDRAELQQELRKSDLLLNQMKQSVGRADLKEDPVVTPILRLYERRMNNVPTSQGNRMAQIADRADDVFNRNENQMVLDVTPNASVQDIADNVAFYRSQLTPDQAEYIDTMNREFETLFDEAREAGIDIGQRHTIKEGGFYLPRGRAGEEGADYPKRFKSGRTSRGATTEAKKPVRFKSMAEGVAAGYEYAPLSQAVRSYVEQLGREIYERKIAEELTALRDPEGRPIAQTEMDRRDPVLRDKMQNAMKKEVRLRDKLRRAEQRFGVESRASDELDRALDDVVEGTPTEGFRGVARMPTVLREQGRRAQGYRQTAENFRSETMRRPEGFPEARISMPPTESRLRQASQRDLRADEVERTVRNVEEAMPEDLERVRFMDTAIKNTAQRAEALSQRGGQAGQRAEQIRADLEAVQREIDELRGPYQADVKRSKSLPPDQQTVALAGMNNYSLPVEMGNAIAKRVSPDDPPLGGALQEVNRILRGMATTADFSGIGIQGTMGAFFKPLQFGRATVLSMKAFLDESVFRKYLQEFDKEAMAKGEMTSREWANHTPIRGVQTEFTFGGGGRGPGWAQALTESAPFRPFTRSFGTFGDVMRLELAKTMSRRVKAQGVDIASKKTLDDIGLTAGRMTGWSPNKVGGKWGEEAFFAPRFWQSQLELTASAFQRGTISGGQAREAFRNMLFGGAMITVAANEASPDGFNYDEFLTPFRDMENPGAGWNPNFMRFRWNGRDFSIFGPWDSLMKGFANASIGVMTGDKDNMLYLPRTKASPLLSAAWDLFEGENFVGEEASLTNANWLMEKFMPISVSQIGGEIIEGDIDTTDPFDFASGAAYELVGLKQTPTSTYEKASEVFNKSDEYMVPDAEGKMEPANSFWDLNNAQRALFERQHPDLAEELKSDPSEELQQYNQVKEMLAKEQQVSDMALIQNEIGIDEWRDQFNDRRTFLRGAGEALFEGGEEGEVNSTDDLYNQIIEENSLPDGGVDWDEVDQRVSKLTPAQQQWIADNRSPGMTNLTQRYLSTSDERNKYFNLPKYRGYSGDEARQIDDIYDRARATLNLPRGQRAPQMRMLRAIRQVQQQYGFDPKVARGARRRVMGMMTETDDREQFLQNNPEVAAFVGSGYLSPDEQNVIGGVDSVLRDAERTR